MVCCHPFQTNTTFFLRIAERSRFCYFFFRIIQINFICYHKYFKLLFIALFYQVCASKNLIPKYTFFSQIHLHFIINNPFLKVSLQFYKQIDSTKTHLCLRNAFCLGNKSVQFVNLKLICYSKKNFLKRFFTAPQWF